MMSRVVVLIGIFALTFGVASAAGGKHRGLNSSGSGSPGAAQIAFDIDPGSCDVSISSTKRIKRVVLKDSDGNVVKKWRKVGSTSFDDFGMYAAYLADGELYVKLGRRGSDVEIGDNFRLALEACLLPSCPVKNEIEQSFADNPPISGVWYASTDIAEKCEHGRTGIVLLNDDGNFSIEVSGASTALDAEQAQACLDDMQDNQATTICRNFSFTN